jgi:hypothetical protein
MFYKIILGLALFVIVAGVFSNSEIGEGMLEFTVKAKAERAINETRDVITASNIYAAKFGDGNVDFGDPDQGEEFLFYIKERDLLQKRVGGENSIIQEWTLDPVSETISGVIAEEKLCRHINSILLSKPIDTPVPECGLVESGSGVCCYNLDV